MNKKYNTIILIGILLFFIFILTGCNNNNIDTNISNININENVFVNNISDSKLVNNDEDINYIVKAWLNLPINLNYNIRKVFNDKNIVVGEYYKRGNDILEAIETRNDGIRPSINNRLENLHYYYKYLGNYSWKAYMYTIINGWEDYPFDGAYPTKLSSNEALMLTKLDNYTNEHIKIYVEGLGNIDTVIGIDGDNKYYYSDKYNINVKIEAKAYTWTLTKYDINANHCPYDIPNK